MRKICLFVIMLFSSLMVVDASSIDKIDMDIYVDSYGNATVTETWNAYVTSGTEGWHPYYNLGNSKIDDVSVSMDGSKFTTVDSWAEDGSLSDKAYKAGLYYPTSDEVDVVFGISSYGSHEYVIKYYISNFVSQVSDADMIYWNLFPKNFSAEPGNVSIKIYSDFSYSDTLDVWGYGKYGAPCYVYDGRIEMTSDGVIGSSEYLTILVKFPKGTFNTDSVLDNDFSYYHNLADEGAVTYTDNSRKTIFWNIISSILSVLFVIFVNILIFIPIIVYSKKDSYSYGKTGKRVRSDVPNFRDIPCNKDIYRAYWVATNYGLTNKKEDFLGTILLKWVHDGNVTIEKVTKNGLFKDKENTNIIFVRRPDNINVEANLYDYMYEASRDGKLETNEFKKWCNKHYSKILKWFDDVLDYEKKELIKEGKIKKVEKKSFKVFKYLTFEVDSSMMSEAEEMAGLKKFLKEFSRIQEREAIEVKLWNEYLMYAQIFGMADKVAEQFKKLYPEIITDMDSIGYTYNDIVFLHTISHDGMQSASVARSRAQSYSSGGGGFSSGGGGGGSFGGGGGGGGFR